MSCIDVIPYLALECFYLITENFMICYDFARFRCLESSHTQIPVKDVQMLPPISNPDKVLCYCLKQTP